MNAFLRLARVELSRLLHRRAILILVGVCLVVPIVIGVAVVLDTRPPSAETIAQAEADLEQARQDTSYQRSVEDCIGNPQDWGIEAGLAASEVEEQCRQQNEPQLDWFLWTATLDLEQEQDGSALAVAMILALAMMLAGTTFIGHDWASGSVSNQLLFEPRRLRVWWAKALVVTGVGVVVAAVVLSTYWLALNAVASSRDLPSGGSLLIDCLQMGWRAAAFAGAAALVGFALTMLFRSTVATVGVIFGISLLGSLILGVFGVEGRWNPALNAAAFVSGEVSYYVEVACSAEEVEDSYGDAYCSEDRVIEASDAAIYLGTAVAGATVASLLWFRRRDVP